MEEKEKNWQIFNKQWIHEDKNEIKIHFEHLNLDN